jgi:hypothetical protein
VIRSAPESQHSTVKSHSIAQSRATTLRTKDCMNSHSGRSQTTTSGTPGSSACIGRLYSDTMLDNKAAEVVEARKAGQSGEHLCASQKRCMAQGLMGLMSEACALCNICSASPDVWRLVFYSDRVAPLHHQMAVNFAQRPKDLFFLRTPAALSMATQLGPIHTGEVQQSRSCRPLC